MLKYAIYHYLRLNNSLKPLVISTTGAVSNLRRFLDWCLHNAVRPVFAFVFPMVLYTLTLAPTIYNLDSAELTTAAATGGLMRATGYPLYLTLGTIWSKIPIGDVGFRMNLFSAFCGALTILLAERIISRWHVRNIATIGALGLLACGPYFWGLSIIAEVYTLHTALMAGLILALLRWQEKPAPSRMLTIGLIAGLSLSHHAATALLIPGSLWMLMVTSPRKLISFKVFGAAIFGLVIGLSSYIYLPLRYLSQPLFNYAGLYDMNLTFHPVDLTRLEGIWWLVSGKVFSGRMFAYDLQGAIVEAKNFSTTLFQAFFLFGIGPGLLGIYRSIRRHWREAGMLGLMFGMNAIFYINYAVIDKQTMYLPTYLIWALWVGLGIQEIFDWLEERPTQQNTRRLARVITTAIVLITGFAIFWNWRLVDLSNDWSTRQRGEAILQAIEPNAIVFGWWDTAPVIQYLQLVEGVRPDVMAINRFLISNEDLTSAIMKEVKIRPVYIDSPPTDLPSNMDTRPTGPVFQIITTSHGGPE